MTVSTYTRKSQYTSDGVITTYPFTFTISTTDDMFVNVTSDTGEDTLLVKDTDYTVEVNDDLVGGNIIFESDHIPINGYLITIYRETEITQETDYVENDPFHADTIENNLDKLTMITQELDERLDRTFRMPITDTNTIPDIPNSIVRSNKVMGFDGSGNIIVTDSTVEDIDAAVSYAKDIGTILSVDSFTGDGVTVAYNLTVTPPNRNSLLITIDGITQDVDAFNVSGSTVTFTEAPPLNALINVRNIGYSRGNYIGDSELITYKLPDVNTVSRSVEDRLSAQYLLSDWGGNLAKALTDIGTDTKTLIIDVGCTLTAGVTVQANVALEFRNGCLIDGPFTLAFAGSPDAQVKALFGQQIYGSSLTVTFGAYGTLYTKWFGSTGDGSTDDTATLQKAIIASYGHKLIWNPGNYRTTTTLIATIPSYAGAISWHGIGHNSKINWYGGNSDVVLQVKGTGGTGLAAKSEIKNLFLHNGNAATGMIGLKIGDETDGVTAGVCNLSIEENEFYGFDINTEIRSESDEVYFIRNRSEGYGSYGLRYYGVGGLRAEQNHFQFGVAGSYAVRAKGNNVTIDNNVIQGATAINGIYFDTCKVFSAINNYTEGTGGTYWINVVASEHGAIRESFIGGYPGATLFNIDKDCKYIDIGNNYHGQSGGFIAAQYAVASGAKYITFSGKIYTDGSEQTPDYTNIETAWNQYEDWTAKTGNRMISKIYSSLGGDKADGLGSEYLIAGSSSQTIFTASAPSMYMVNITQGTEKYSCTAIVHVPAAGTTAEIFEIGKTNANLTLTISGLNVVANNGVGAARAVYWTATRFY